MGPYEPISLTRSSSVTAGGSLRMKTERESGSMPGIAAGIALPPMPPPPIAPPPMTPPPIAPAPAIAPPAMPAMPLAAGLPPIPPPPPPPIICDAACSACTMASGLPPAMRTCWSSACSICGLLVRAVTICGLLCSWAITAPTAPPAAVEPPPPPAVAAPVPSHAAELGWEGLPPAHAEGAAMGPAGGAARLGCMDMIDPVTGGVAARAGAVSAALSRSHSSSLSVLDVSAERRRFAKCATIACASSALIRKCAVSATANARRVPAQFPTSTPRGSFWSCCGVGDVGGE